MQELLTQAQHLHAYGLNIVPVGVWHKTDDSDRPRLDYSTPHDQPNEGYRFVYKAVRGKWKDLRENRQDLSELNENFFRNATGMGCVTGSTPVFCIDFDNVPNLALIDTILENLGLPMLYEWVSISGSGKGFHVWLRCEDWQWLHDDPVLNQSGKADNSVYMFRAKQKAQFDHLELRIKQHTVLPPSLHESGQHYEWLHELPSNEMHTVGQAEIMALLEMCVKPEPKAEPQPIVHHAPANDNLIERIKRGFDWRLYIQHNHQDGNHIRKDGKDWRIGKSGAGYGTILLDDSQHPFKFNHPQSGWDGGCGAIDLVMFVSGGMRKNGLAFKDAVEIAAKYAGISEEEIRQSRREYMKAQESQPKPKRKTDSNGSHATETPFTEEELVQHLVWGEERGLATVWGQMAQDRFLYDTDLKLWLEYLNGVWVEIEETDVIWDISSNMEEQMMDMFKFADGDDIFSKKVHSTIKRLKKIPLCKNTSILAQSLLKARATDFDTQHHLLTLANGAYDLTADKFVPHSPSHLSKTKTDIQYNAQADAPKWLAFLDTVFVGNTELIRFVQQWVGLALTGFTDFQGLFFAYGGGKNGKSVFFNALRILLGGYCKSIKVETIRNNNGTRSAGEEAQIANMKGARMVITSEVSQNMSLDEAAVKDMTGGEPITAKRMHKNPVTFSPTHKLAMFGNHKPKIKGNDNGFWRRMYLVPFLATIPEEQRRDMREILAEFQVEIAGMLNWAIAGYRDFAKNGLIVPKIVNEAVEEYRKNSDPLGDFLEEVYELNPTGSAVAKDVWEAYRKFCEELGTVQSFKSNRTFYKSLTERGCKAEKGAANKKMLIGICLRDPNSGLPF